MKAIAYAINVGCQDAVTVFLHSTDEVEREVWAAIVNKALEMHQQDQEQQAIMIANKLSKIFR